MKEEIEIKPNPDSRDPDSVPSRCAFDALLWIVVLLLMLSFGVFVILGAALSLRGIPAPAFGAAIAAGVFAALILAMLLLAYFALSVFRLCFVAHSQDAKRPNPGKVQ